MRSARETPTWMEMRANVCTGKPLLKDTNIFSGITRLLGIATKKLKLSVLCLL